MKKQIINVSVFQAAKVAAALYFVMSVVMIALFAIPAMMFGSGPGWPMIYLVLAPVFYVVIGFIFTAIGAFTYNIVASVVGGFEFTTKEVD